MILGGPNIVMLDTGRMVICWPVHVGDEPELSDDKLVILSLVVVVGLGVALVVLVWDYCESRWQLEYTMGQGWSKLLPRHQVLLLEIPSGH